MRYSPNPRRYDTMLYHRCGRSGLLLPAVSLGLWHSFGHSASQESMRQLVLGALDMGITHFDLANNYGPPPGAAEEALGRLLATDLAHHRDELIISTKAGYDMWAGPYGNWGSKKYLVASLDQSLRRLGLDYVDIFYHHRPDPDTPLEESMGALAHIVQQGKALYVGLSNYSPEQTEQAVQELNRLGVHCLIHQPRYSMLDRAAQKLFPVLAQHGVGCIAFSPLAQGLLTDKYLGGIPQDSRAAGSSVFLNEQSITPALLAKIEKLNAVAQQRGQSLAQMALAWAIHTGGLTSVVMGASRLVQLEDNIRALDNVVFATQELADIEAILAD